MKSLLIPFVLLLSLLGQSVCAQSSEAERMNTVIAAAIDVIYGECSAELAIEEKQVRVRALLDAEYDLDVIIRRAIGRNWKLFKTDEQARVLELIKQLVIKAYVKALQNKKRPTFELGEVVTVSDKRIEIPCTVEFEGQPLYVLYRLGKMKSGWQIYDIVVEDISVVSNYRQQIDDHFRKGNGAELIAKLEQLLNTEDLDNEIKL